MIDFLHRAMVSFDTAADAADGVTMAFIALSIGLAGALGFAAGIAMRESIAKRRERRERAWQRDARDD